MSNAKLAGGFVGHEVRAVILAKWVAKTTQEPKNGLKEGASSAGIQGMSALG